MSSLLTTTNYLSNRATYIVCFASVIATQEIPPDFCKENTYSEGLYRLVTVVGEMFKKSRFFILSLARYFGDTDSDL